MTMSEAPRYDEGAEPAIRRAEKEEDGRHLADFRCPYCGSNALLISSGDLLADKYRIELYCDNSMCDVREMAILPLRMDGPVSWSRTDVKALRVIDEGTEAEQEAEGYELHRNDAGEVDGRSISLGGLLEVDLDSAVLKRREREAKIKVEPDS